MQWGRKRGACLDAALTPACQCSHKGCGSPSRPLDETSAVTSRQEKLQETSSAWRSLAACIHCAGGGRLAGNTTRSPACARATWPHMAGLVSYGTGGQHRTPKSKVAKTRFGAGVQTSSRSAGRLSVVLACVPDSGAPWLVQLAMLPGRSAICRAGGICGAACVLGARGPLFLLAALTGATTSTARTPAAASAACSSRKALACVLRCVVSGFYTAGLLLSAECKAGVAWWRLACSGSDVADCIT